MKPLPARWSDPASLLAPLPSRASESKHSGSTNTKPTGFRAASASGRTQRGRALPDTQPPPADSPAGPAAARPGAQPRAQPGAAAPADLAGSSAIPRCLALRTRPPAPQGPSRPPRRLSMVRCRVASGCHGGRRRVGRSCSQNWGESLKQRERRPSWTAGSRGDEPRPRGGDRVTGGGPPGKAQAGPPRFYAERDVGGSPRSPRCLGTPPGVIAS